ncbi:MAG: GntG family PLP-dependent aldolase [Thalassobaculales bacterium]
MSRISLASDGRDPSPAETAARLHRLTTAATRADNYGLGGVVAEFEARAATLLGKEAALLVATGTLAQMLAIEALCPPGRRRVLVQADGHVMNDTGDAAARLGGFTLVPLAPGRPGFGAAEVEAALARIADLRVASPAGALVLETPVRRHHSARVPVADQLAVAACARRHGFGLHLDGARLPIEAAWSGRSLAEVAAPFDTVYLSLWKMFDCPFGAILAGPAALLEGLYHERRRRGGGLWQMWPPAVLGLDAAERVEGEWQAVRRHAEAVLAALADSPWRIERVAEGSHVVRLHLPGGDPAATRAAALAEGLELPPPAGDGFWVKCNPGWLAREPADIAAALSRAARPG